MSEFNPHENYFSLLAVPQRYEVSVPDLTRRYRELQRDAHPDRFAGGTERERLQAVQYSSQINEAYEALVSPTRRAAYLLSLAGVESDMSSTTFQDPEFLMQQMELREELSELQQASDPELALDQFYGDIDTAADQQKLRFSEQYTQRQFDDALATYAKLQFLEKLRSEAELKESELLDY
ncbi:Co-chaperone protein HscB [Zhongshania aliphaticivorans]|uniref:Co-chaperone protein HscB homolog n=1 Tax=Zhongshania aliphaticivorans TaxID=1470434 RepID=A0A5S9MSP0_9GAMM|nr:Fe-S protein assembly co-chaperone HscB [Zhongshania aliphaticivorans]CAA0078477.1 Co-chaperone protein HscB [Zhongshania aliphaticivorans]CAA0086637.1 Co-chaperone protein HscB [Zhongshania aliphaticivorans]